MLTTIVVVAVAGRRSSTQPPALTPKIPTLLAAAGAASGLDGALRGPSPPPAVDVPRRSSMIHGGPTHTHRARAVGPKTADKIGFHVAVGGPVTAQVTTSPDEATLYVATLGGELIALSRADGSKQWSASLGDRAYSAPLVHEDVVYVGSDAKKLFAFKNGTSVFRLDTDDEVDTSPAFTKDGAIVVAAGKWVYSVRRGGDVAWRFGTKKKVFTSPAITAEGLVIVGAQDHHVYALGAAGLPEWSVDLGADVDGAAAIGDDGAIYVGTDAGDVVRLSSTGEIVWRTKVGGFVRGTLSVARNGDVVAGTYGPVPRVVRITADGFVRGAFAIQGTGAREFGIHGGPLEDDEGTLYFGAQDDAAYAVGVDGAVRWRFSTNGDVDAPLTMLSDGSLIVPSEDGTVTLLLP